MRGFLIQAGALFSFVLSSMAQRIIQPSVNPLRKDSIIFSASSSDFGPERVPERGVVLMLLKKMPLFRFSVCSDPMARLPSFPRGGFLEYPFPVAAKTGTSRVLPAIFKDWAQAQGLPVHPVDF